MGAAQQEERNAQNVEHFSLCFRGQSESVAKGNNLPAPGFW